jgi:hypothetical protein
MTEVRIRLGSINKNLTFENIQNTEQLLDSLRENNVQLDPDDIVILKYSNNGWKKVEGDNIWALESAYSPKILLQIIQKNKQQTKKFFGDRPPSELISSNLGDFFPEDTPDPENLKRSTLLLLKESKRSTKLIT